MCQEWRFGAGVPRRRGLQAVLLLAAAVVFGEVCTLPLELAARARVAGAPPGWMLPLDDAYIFVRYAQQAARGRPWQWNTGEPSTGASSALWTWLLVPPHWWSGELAVWSLWSRWMGVASLWALGLAAARALRAAGLAEPWPLAGGLCLVWSGPVGFGAVAGMESAGNAALLVLACALWMESLGAGSPAALAAPSGIRGWRRAPVWALVATSLLPLARPENGVLTLVAALAILSGGRRGGASAAASGFGAAGAAGKGGAAGEGGSAGEGGAAGDGGAICGLAAAASGSSRATRSSGEGDGRLPWRRWTGLAVLLPGALLAACNRIATGSFEPAGAVVKSWLYLPFLPFGAKVAHYLAVLRRGLLPVYLGAKPAALWPPVGLLAVATAAASLAAAAVRWRRDRAARNELGGAGQHAGARNGDPVPAGLAATAPLAQSAGPAQSAGLAGSAATAPPALPTAPAGLAPRAALVRPSPLAVLAPLAPLAVAWLVLTALAPLSILLLWQEMRHHHAGLALAWLLALAGAGLGGEALAARRRQRQGRLTPAGAVAGAALEGRSAGAAYDDAAESRAAAAPVGRAAAVAGRRGPPQRLLPLLLPLLLVLAFPHWARESVRGVIELYRGHARAAAWLAAHDRQRTLLLTDAGLLAIAHDGPAIDALGLGSPDLTEASLHGPGALVESLARRRPLPEIAAAEPRLLKLPQLLGEPLLPGPPPAGDFTVLARVRRELLAGTALPAPARGSGLDFAYLPDERRHLLIWQPPPLPPNSSFALLLPAPGQEHTGAPALQGCRPLFGGLGVELPSGTVAVGLRAAVLAPAPAGQVLATAGDERGPAGAAPLAVIRLAADRWSDAAVTLPVAGASYLWLARRGPGLPCLESLRFTARPGARR
jgi:hypothetical protein